MTLPLLIANWKMNVPPEGIGVFCSEVLNADLGAVRIVVAPPFPYLAEVAAALKPAATAAAQDCSDQRSGAYTGEVSADMIAACGGRLVIVGHSERRARWGEDNVMVAAKIGRARQGLLHPVLCVGEPLEVRERGETGSYLGGQLSLPAPTFRGMTEVIVAYEPVWAIGTGRNASGALVAETVALIRRELLPAVDPGTSIAVLYGGSVTPGNVDELVDSGEVDGFLVGGASLSSAGFIEIGRSIARRALQT